MRLKSHSMPAAVIMNYFINSISFGGNNQMINPRLALSTTYENHYVDQANNYTERTLRLSFYEIEYFNVMTRLLIKFIAELL